MQVCLRLQWLSVLLSLIKIIKRRELTPPLHILITEIMPYLGIGLRFPIAHLLHAPAM